MNFWEHVEELRHVLLRSFFIICIVFVIVLGFYQPILKFLTIQSEWQETNDLVQQKVIKSYVTNRSKEEKIFTLPNDAWVISETQPKKYQKDGDKYFLPSGHFLHYEQAIDSPFLIMSPIDGLTLVFKVCFWISVVISSPIWGWFWLHFILPGLKSHEQSLLIPFICCSIFSLLLGLFFAYKVTLPIANEYLALFNQKIGQNAWTLTSYVNYVLLILLGHAIAAESAFLLLLAVHYGLFSTNWLQTKRRYMAILTLILGAILTPPDVFSQLLMAIPLMGIYEIAIAYSKWRTYQEKRIHISI